MKTGRSVKWTSDRSEAFMTDAHGRDHVTTAKMGFDSDGKIVGFHVDTIANIGAYVSLFATATPTYLYGTLWSGTYDIPAIYGTVRAVHTNTVPVDAYRGAGRPEATYMIERMMEKAAREMGMDPAELRRKNFIKEFPYQTQVLLQYDSGDYHTLLDMAQKHARSTVSPNARPRPHRAASCAASAIRPSWRPAALRHRQPPGPSARAWASGNPPKCG
jgi:carbon-monoxide dehydrogenase large subunit